MPHVRGRLRRFCAPVLAAILVVYTTTPGGRAATGKGGLRVGGNQLFDQNSPGIEGASESGLNAVFSYRVGDHFGKALAAGDFNGDGYEDLAIGVPDEDADDAPLICVVFDCGSSIGKGAVSVIYGSGSGLHAAAGPGDQLFEQPSAEGDQFGAALVAADFNGDGYADLAVGVPGQHSATDGTSPYPNTGQGSVTIIYGSAGGLSSSAGPRTQILDQDTHDVEGAREQNDRFGAALAAGDFNRDGCADLVVGIPGEDSGSGAVALVYGQASGLVPDAGPVLDVLFDQDSGGVEGAKESGDEFGARLVVGDFDGDGFQDLAIGVPGEDEVGAVAVQYGTVSGLSPDRDRLLIGIGAPLAAGNFNADSSDDLVTTDRVLLGVSSLGPVEAFNRFFATAAAAAVGDFNHDGFADLARGRPERPFIEFSGEVSWGEVEIRHGERGSPVTGFPLQPAADQVWSQATDGIEGDQEKNDRFGSALATGDFNGDGADDLAVGVPNEDGDAGAVNIIYGSGNRPPAAHAGADQTIECGGPQTPVALDATASTDPDADVLTYAWSEGPRALGTGARLNVVLPFGAHTITLTVTDPDGASSQDTTSVTIRDTRPPAITAPPALTVYTGAGAVSCSRVIPDAQLGAATAVDACSTATVTRTGVPAGNMFPVGKTTITYTATDAVGHQTSQTQEVTVIDDTAPAITGVSVSNAQLWPPNHKMVDLLVGYSVADNCAVAQTALGVTSNEPIDGLGDGDTAPDWEIIDARRLRLRAERMGGGTGRIYTIAIRATDIHGNAGSQPVQVRVPHNANK